MAKVTDFSKYSSAHLLTRESVLETEVRTRAGVAKALAEAELAALRREMAERIAEPVAAEGPGVASINSVKTTCPCGDNDGNWCSLENCPWPHDVADAAAARPEVASDPLDRIERRAKIDLMNARALKLNVDAAIAAYDNGIDLVGAPSALDAELAASGIQMAGGSILRPSIADVAAERRRQIEDEGFTAEDDARWPNGDLARAGACYALNAFGESTEGRILWPFVASWWKPSDDHRRNLVKAAALILAEIDRMDHQAGEAAWDSAVASDASQA